MTVVVDANLLIVLVSRDPRREVVRQQFHTWITQEINIHAPDLALYEVTNSLTRLIRANLFPRQEIAIAWESLSQLSIVYHRLNSVSRVVEIALTLERQSAYDVAYLSLAESLDAELWTLDGPLYRNAISYGFAVRLLQ